MRADRTAPVEVLGIAVERRDLEEWLDWYMPDVQPFLVPRDVAARLGLEDAPGRLTMELRDTYWIYGDQRDAVCWLDRAASRTLPPAVRREQHVVHRWPSGDVESDVSSRATGRRLSRHTFV